MKKSFQLIILVIAMQAAFSLAAQTPRKEPINEEYVRQDLAGIKALAPVPLPEQDSFDIFQKRFDSIPAYASWTDEENLGFDARRVKMNKGFGSITGYVDLLIFKNQIAYYQLGLKVHGSDLEVNELLREWKKNGGPDLTLRQDHVSTTNNFEAVWADYKSLIAKSLGPIQSAAIPAALKEAYSLLVNPLINSRITGSTCDDGKAAIDKLANAKRIDLIENVLRGYNPGGRIYAAIVLLRMQKRGLKLNVAAQTAIQTVENLDADAGTCWADMGQTGMRAKRIIPEYVKSKDWFKNGDDPVIW